MPSSCRQKQTSDVLWCCCGGHQPFFDKHHQLPKQKAGRVVASDPLPSGGERSLLQDSLKVGNRGWKCWMENWGYALKKNLSNIGAGLCSRKGKKTKNQPPKPNPSVCVTGISSECYLDRALICWWMLRSPGTVLLLCSLAAALLCVQRGATPIGAALGKSLRF